MAKTEPATTKISAANTFGAGAIPLIKNAAKGVKIGLMKNTVDAAVAEDFYMALKNAQYPTPVIAIPK